MADEAKAKGNAAFSPYNFSNAIALSPTNLHRGRPDEEIGIENAADELEGDLIANFLSPIATPFSTLDPGAYDECLNFLEYLETSDANLDEAFIGWVSVSEKQKGGCKLPQNSWDPWSEEQRKKGIYARSRKLRPGGPLACELARHAVVLQVEDWICCHGGLLHHHVAYGIERMNEEVS